MLGGETLIHFIDKAGGGVRPIGIAVPILRVWSKIRGEEARVWERQHAQPFVWGTAAQPCEKASWEHNLLCAWVGSKGLCVLSFISDLEKFYEFAAHTDLMAEAAATNFNKRLLRGFCCLYAGRRAICYNMSVSESFNAYGTILASCLGAAAIAKLLL